MRRLPRLTGKADYSTKMTGKLKSDVYVEVSRELVSWMKVTLEASFPGWLLTADC
jgi:hypothetical protein